MSDKRFPQNAFHPGRTPAFLNAFLDFSKGCPSVVDVRIQAVPGFNYEDPTLPNTCCVMLAWASSATSFEEARDYLFERITSGLPGNRLAWVQDWFSELQENEDE